jgi:hypothetical protein
VPIRSRERLRLSTEQKRSRHETENRALKSSQIVSMRPSCGSGEERKRELGQNGARYLSVASCRRANAAIVAARRRSACLGRSASILKVPRRAGSPAWRWVPYLLLHLVLALARRLSRSRTAELSTIRTLRYGSGSQAWSERPTLNEEGDTSTRRFPSSWPRDRKLSSLDTRMNHQRMASSRSDT